MKTQAESANYALDNLLTELELIKNLEIRDFTKAAILCAPGLYWYKPSAFYKGHHPDDELGEWGNLIHVKRTIVIGRIFAEIENLDSITCDTLYSGMTIHDLGKYDVLGDCERIVKHHPDLVSAIVLGLPQLPQWELLRPILLVATTHMGRWGNVKPNTLLEKLGHYCDCIAARVSVSIPITLK